MSETLILSVGTNMSILDARETVLRSAGYIVVSAMSVKEALQLFQNGDFDLLVLCQTLAAKDRERLTCWIRASGSRVPVVSVSEGPKGRNAFSDATVGQSSAELIVTVKHLLARRLELATTAHRAHRQAIRVLRSPETRKAPAILNAEKKVPASDFSFSFGGIEFMQPI